MKSACRTGIICSSIAVGFSTGCSDAADFGEIDPQFAEGQMVGPRPHSTDALFLEIGQDVAGFGGMYYDDSGDLLVRLVDTRQVDTLATHLDRFSARFSKPSTGRTIRAVQAKYSFAQLYGWKAIANQLFSTGQIIWTDVDEAMNRVTIAVSDNRAVPSLRSAIVRAGIPDDAVVFLRDHGLRPVATLRDTIRPLMAGLQVVELSTRGWICTLGPLLELDGQKGGFVNSHCTSTLFGVDNNEWHQSWLNRRIGREISDPPNAPWMGCDPGFLCRYSDAAFIAFDDTVQWGIGTVANTLFPSPDSTSLEIDSSNPFFETRATYGIVDLVGYTVYKTGRTTGTTYGEIVNSCLDIYYTGLILKCQDKVYGAYISGGDSGSPVWRPVAQDSVDIIGIAHSQSWASNAPDGFIFSDTWGLIFDHAQTGPYSFKTIRWK